MLDMAVAVLGLASLTDEVVRDRIAEESLVWVQPDWSPTLPKYRLHYEMRSRVSELGNVPDA